MARSGDLFKERYLHIIFHYLCYCTLYVALPVFFRAWTSFSLLRMFYVLLFYKRHGVKAREKARCNTNSLSQIPSKKKEIIKEKKKEEYLAVVCLLLPASSLLLLLTVYKYYSMSVGLARSLCHFHAYISLLYAPILAYCDITSPNLVLHGQSSRFSSGVCVCVCVCVCISDIVFKNPCRYLLLCLITFSISMYIMCVCLFSALSRRVGALQISIIIIIIIEIRRTTT